MGFSFPLHDLPREYYKGGIIKRSISCCYQICCTENVDVVGVAASPRRLILVTYRQEFTQLLLSDSSKTFSYHQSDMFISTPRRLGTLPGMPGKTGIHHKMA